MWKSYQSFLLISFLLLGCNNLQDRNKCKHENVFSGENSAANNALFAACKNGDLGAVESAISNGANINATDENGDTPLHYAVEKGAIDIVKFLVSNGADATTEDVSGITPISIAVVGGHWEILEWFIEECTTLDWRKMVCEGYNFHERFKACQPDCYMFFGVYLEEKNINIEDFLKQTEVITPAS